MRSVLTIALLLATLLPAVGRAAPWGRPAPRLHLVLRVPRVATSAPVERALRELPAAAESPGAYARVTRWVENVALPRRTEDRSWWW